MGGKQGFEIYVNDVKYRVRCDTSRMTGVRDQYYSNKVTLKIQVWREDNAVKVDPTSYVAEKIEDFIRNCINGQDTCYWNPEGKNRHLKEDEDNE